jgi:diguanylate cyclase (GGDEF)-like protein
MMAHDPPDSQRDRFEQRDAAVAGFRELIRTMGPMIRHDDEQSLLEFVVATAAGDLGWDRCAIAIRDDDGSFRYRAEAGNEAMAGDNLVSRVLTTPAFDALIAASFVSGGVRSVPPGHEVLQRQDVSRGIVRPDRAGARILAGAAETPAPAGRLLFVPLIGAGGETLGFLHPDSHAGSTPAGPLAGDAAVEDAPAQAPRPMPSASEALMLETLAEVASIALEIVRARMNERATAALAEVQHRELEVLLESFLSASIKVRGTLALDEVLSQMALALTTAGGFGRAAVYLLGEDGRLVVRATVGLSPEEDAHLRSESISREEIAPLMQPEMQISRSYFFDHRYFEIPKELDAKLEIPPPSATWRPGQWHAEDSLTVPLNSVDGEFVGLISVDNPLDGLLPDRAHVQALEYFADQCAVAFTESRRYATVQEQASTDELTGLPNRRAFTEAAARTVTRSLADGRSCSVLFIDLDHFKTVNDTLGHAAGDDLLQRVAHVLSARLRRGDLLARYGGEEFIVLLPDTGAQAATELAELFRQKVAAIRDDPVAGGLPVTASIGVASLSPDIASTDALLVAADGSLYEAKRAGRDCVRVHSAES